MGCYQIVDYGGWRFLALKLAYNGEDGIKLLHCSKIESSQNESEIKIERLLV